MTDTDLVAKKLLAIEAAVGELRQLVQPDEVLHDLRAERFAAFTLIIGIQAMLDVAAHIVSDERLGEPTDNRALFELIAHHGWIPPEMVATLRDVVGFRNLLVQRYARVDKAILHDVIANRLTDLDAFVAAIRARLPGDAHS